MVWRWLSADAPLAAQNGPDALKDMMKKAEPITNTNADPPRPAAVPIRCPHRLSPPANQVAA